jgi:hypothetical protein
VPIISACNEPGCETLTIGAYCIEHEHVAADEPIMRELAADQATLKVLSPTTPAPPRARS